MSGLVLLGGFVLAEVVVRTFAQRRTPPTEAGPRLIQPCDDPRVRFENRPGARQVLRFFDSEGGVASEVEAVINEDGYRGPAVAKEKPAGTIRIVAAGDSQTFGTGVAEGESWPSVLEASLRKSLPEVRVEVLNVAVPGYNADQAAAALETRWLAYGPDLVLLGYFVNDPTPPDPRADDRKTWSRRLLGALLPSQRGFVAWTRKHSALVDLVLDGIYRRVLVHEWAKGALQLHGDESQGWKRTQAVLTEERDAAARRGARFAMVLLPFLVRHGDGLISTEPYEKVTKYCAASGIPVLDLEPCFAGVDVGTLLVHERDSHSSAAAHQLEGEAIARWILDQRLLPER